MLGLGSNLAAYKKPKLIPVYAALRDSKYFHSHLNGMLVHLRSSEDIIRC